MKKDWMIRESELDEDQIQVLMATLNKSCIVSGCAGSGKSILALIKAKRIQEAFGSNYQVIVFTKALCKYMNTGRLALGLHKPFFYHWEWRNRLNAPAADYLVVDEIQDFDQEEILEFVAKTNKNFFFFGDTAQSIYNGMGMKTTIPVNEIKGILPSTKRQSVKEFELYRNYRLPLPVAKLAYHVGEGLNVFLEQTYRSKETAIPRIIKYPTQNDQLRAIHDIIKKNTLTDVAILLPKNQIVKNTYNALNKLGGNYEVRYRENVHSTETLDFESENPKIMTYHSAKGLQFETIFLPFIEDFDEKERKALYVAMTRTYRNLYIMHSKDLPKILRNIDHSLYKTTEFDDIKDI